MRARVTCSWVMKMKNENRLGQLGRMFVAVIIAAMFLTAPSMVLADTEPNDSMAQAESIYDGDTVYGSLDDSTDPDDYYEIYLSSGDMLMATMTGTGDDFDLFLYDDSGWEVDSSTSGSSFESIYYTASSSGYYYINPNALWGSGTYTLTVSVISTGGGGGGGGGGTGAQLPVWNVGDGWWFGKTWDFDAMQAEIDANLNEAIAQLPGFNADATVAGGVGLYFGVEVVDDAFNLNGVDCYKVDFDGALGIDFGLDAYVKGSMNEEGISIRIDASGNAVVVAEASLVGSLYFTVDQLAFAKGEFTLTADGTADVDLDVDFDMSYDLGAWGSESMSGHIVADAHGEIDNAQLSGALEFDPAIDFFDFPIYLGDTWNVPHTSTDVTGTWSGSGTISWEVDVTGMRDIDPSAQDIHESDSVDLAQEIGSGSVDDIIEMWQAVGLRCTQVIDDRWYIIEADTGEIFGYFDFPGTKQYGIDPMDMIGDVAPQDAGVQFDTTEGFVTGMTMDGEVMTEASDKASVESFASDPLGEVQEDTGGHGSVGTGAGGGIMVLLILGIIVIVVVLVVVMVIVGRRKKTPPQQQMYGAPPYQQQQYQQPPPQQQPPPPQQEQPPPPPPQGY